jgi:hypothetical protein
MLKKNMSGGAVAVDAVSRVAIFMDPNHPHLVQAKLSGTTMAATLLSVFSAINKVYKIVCFQFRVGLANMDTRIYHGSCPSCIL